MKVKISLFIAFLFICQLSLAQRFGYMDSDYILSSLPQYEQAQQRLQQQAEGWQREINQKQEFLNDEKIAYQSEKILLTDQQIADKEQSFLDLADEIATLQERRYGPNGDMITIRKKLVQPIQDQIWNAVKSVAERRKYSFVFDKGSDLVMVYSDPKYDISQEVLKQLLPKGASVPQPNRQRNNNKNAQSKRTRSPQLNKLEKK